jgi:hypothetical protein
MIANRRDYACKGVAKVSLPFYKRPLQGSCDIIQEKTRRLIIHE